MEVNQFPSYEGYQPDPQRGCGKKKKGGFYVEAEGSSAGVLRLWTHVLGSNVATAPKQEKCYLKVPARKVVQANPAASIMTNTLYDVGVPTDHLDRRRYDKLRDATAEIALFDHVGSEYYTPTSFRNEVCRLGPSRRIVPSLAKEIATLVPIPIFFTHSEVPVFRNFQHRDKVIQFVGKMADDWNLEEVCYRATWQREQWGLYQDKEYDGSDHYLLAVMQIMDRWSDLPEEYHAEALNILELVMDVEQPFGASWITKVSYVPTGEDEHPVSESPGIEWLRI